MTEVDFTRTFLAQLSQRPVRIQPDYVQDPKQYPSKPVTPLPKLPNPMRKRLKRTSPSGSVPSANIHLRTLRPPHSINDSLPATPLTTTFHSIKADLSTRTSVPADKLRFLVKGKILSDAKTVGEVVADGEEVVVSVMLMGGAVVKVPEATTTAEAKTEMEEKEEEKEEEVEHSVDQMEVDAVTVESAQIVLAGGQFWSELKGFLKTKIPKGEEAEEVVKVFRQSWESKAS